MALFRFRPRPSVPRASVPRPSRSRGSAWAGQEVPGPGRTRGSVRRYLLRNRRLLAALCFCAAAGLTVQALLPPEQSYTTVAAARGDLPAGTVLQASQLSSVRLPAEAVPAGSVPDPESAAGRRLAHPLPDGTPLTESVLLGPGLLHGLPAGTAAVPIRPADPAAARLLRAGELVDVVEAGETGFGSVEPARVLARDLPVLWAGTAASDAGGLAAGPWAGGGDDAGLVILAVPGELAADLSAVSAQGTLSLVLTGSG